MPGSVCGRCKGRGVIYTPDRRPCPSCAGVSRGDMPRHIRWQFMNQDADPDRMHPSIREEFLACKRAYEEWKAEQERQ